MLAGQRLRLNWAKLWHELRTSGTGFLVLGLSWGLDEDKAELLPQLDRAELRTVLSVGSIFDISFHQTSSSHVWFPKYFPRDTARIPFPPATWGPTETTELV